jgi:alpha-galactosidase
LQFFTTELPIMPDRHFFECGGLYIGIEVTPHHEARLVRFAPQPPPSDLQVSHRFQSLVEIQVTGENHADHHGAKYTGTLPGTRMCFQTVRQTMLPDGCLIEIDLVDEPTQLFATYALRMYDIAPVLQAWLTLENRGVKTLGLEYVSSFALWGLLAPPTRRWDTDARLHLPHHSWNSEFQWRSYRLPELGLSSQSEFSFKRVAVNSTGTWSSAEYLPMGILEDNTRESCLFWQIEHNGSWHWEIGDKEHELYLRLGGPTQRESQWWKPLAPGEKFESVPVAVGCCLGGIEAVFRALTRYRRATRRAHPDQQTLPIIFNDYMNCLMGDPTSEKLMPLIARAAELGCEVFTIDAGWHGDGAWWDTVGAWEPSELRFPGGFTKVVDAIRDARMIPGLWLEIEVVGVGSPLARSLPDSCFFMRYGKRVIENGRYQLDFRHPAVIAHADGIIDRLVSQYGIGYFKLDYNINAGVGTDVGASSLGQGLLEHNRAYLQWLDTVLDRHPHLIIEGCASGGMRMDGALVSRVSLNSSSDQMDYRPTARIAAASSSALPPEQCANWVYPLASADDEAIIFNLVNGMLARIHLSGELVRLSNEQLEWVSRGLSRYRRIREGIPHSLPLLPLGLPTTEEGWLCVGLESEHHLYIAVWRLAATEEQIDIPVQVSGQWQLGEVFPSYAAHHCVWDSEAACLRVRLHVPYSARLISFERDLG